jgi:hypothetical protein
LNEEEILAFKYAVQHSYSYKLYIDDLPSATVIKDFNDHSLVDYFEGIPIGLYSV